MGFFRRQSRGTRLFFASDIHGSEQCFRKWLNAARVYEVDVLILGGDITGKALVPLVRENGVWTGEFFGKRVQAQDEAELARLQQQIRMVGSYDLLLTPHEKEALDASPRGSTRRFTLRSATPLGVGLNSRMSGSPSPAFRVS